MSESVAEFNFFLEWYSQVISVELIVIFFLVVVSFLCLLQTESLNSEFAGPFSLLANYSANLVLFFEQLQNFLCLPLHSLSLLIYLRAHLVVGFAVVPNKLKVCGEFLKVLVLPFLEILF